MRHEGDKRGPDARIARIAANQHGVLTTEQLRAVCLSSSGIRRRAATGRLHPVHRGVYAVGHRNLSTEGRWMAAVLACGAGAVLSHQSAGELWGIRRRARRPPEAVRPGEPGAAHVTVPITRGKRARDGIVIHRSSTLTDSDCTRRDGIPVTKAARTLADLQAVLSPPELAAARREAEFLRLPIGEPPSVDRARTDLEAVFLSLCRRHRLPMPAVNAGVDRYEVDFLWPNVQLIVEVDGWESHRTRSAFEEDRARDARLAVLGYEVMRFTWRQIRDDRAGVARMIRSLLRARSYAACRLPFALRQ
jgi:very-short-patch-repair endonuclease